VLLRRATLDGIRAGDVDLAFRRWERPRVRAGTRLRTAVGLVEVVAVREVDPVALTARDATRAGLGLEQLRAMLARREAGAAYRVELRFAGADPRVALRARRPDAAERATLAERLARYDRASPRGPWTAVTLAAIAERPATLAADLAAALGRDTTSFKRDVRKLKELGLTESLDVGYRLSPRGVAFLGS
jgi:hypothetical protein